MLSLLGALGEHFHIAPHKGTSLHGLASELGKIDRELGRLRSAMLAIKCELGRQVALTCKRRNSITPFGKLPLELVGSILHRVVATSPGPPYHRTDGYTKVVERQDLATVCTGWWRTIQSTPEIWTDIELELDNTSLALKLRKSGSLPLNILLPWHYITPRSTLELLAAHCQRWQYAYLDLRGDGTLEYAREVFGMHMPRLEALSILCVCPPLEHDPLELVTGDLLHHLVLQEILPQSGSPALRTIRCLTLTNTLYARVPAILDILASTSVLETLTIISVGWREDAVITSTVRLPTLQKLIVKGVTESFGTALLAGLDVESLTSLTIEVNAPSWEDGGIAMFGKLVQPNGHPRRSILSTVIANSTAETIHILIDGNSSMNITGPNTNEDVLCIKLLSSQWFAYFSGSMEFGTSDIDLPPIQLKFAMLEPVNLRSASWILNLHLYMPFIVSITIETPGLAARLFQDDLAKEHMIGGNACWACPSLKMVWIARTGQGETLEADVDTALERRALADQTLPNITVWWEEESGEWVKRMPPDRSHVTHSHAM